MIFETQTGRTNNVNKKLLPEVPKLKSKFSLNLALDCTNRLKYTDPGDCVLEQNTRLTLG